jgi:hypothetical protein
MLTLNQATQMTKRTIKWLSLIVGLIILVFFALRATSIIRNIVSPEPPPPPEVKFGKIPAVAFPQGEQKNYSYTVDTVTGELPTFSDRAKVFKIVQESPDLLALQKTGEKVAQAGFSQGPVRIKDNIYQWTNSNSKIASKINIDIYTSEFNVSSSFLSDPDILIGRNFPKPSDAQTETNGFLTSMNLLSKDIDLNKTKVNFFSIQNGTLVPTTSESSAHIIEVVYFQKDIEKIPIYYPVPWTSTMNVLIGGGLSTSQVVQANFFHQDISLESSTYPIKTADEAFKELEEGRAYIASGEKEDVLIQKVTLGYYLSDVKQNYLMPIIVFEGNNGFIAYASAVKVEWINM